jgi:hypothetical protein
MFGILALIVVGAFVGIPILAVCSFRNRAASRPETLPTWRNRTGIVSLGVILCVWLFLVVLTILRIINESWRYILTENMNAGPILLAVAASISCIALKGPARTQAIMAGVLLFILAVLATFWLPGDF